MSKDATMNKEAGSYQGQDRFECRESLWADMEAAWLTLKKQNYTINVPRSQRGGEIIEPLVSKQWYVDAEPLAKMGLTAVHSGRIKIIPERFVKVWDNWLENIRPWCISRQLWWGHRIPVWYCADCDHITVAREDPTACEGCGSTRIEQDPDVLDTWFSSGLWPFSTLGWPEQTPDLARFYPTDVMETGYDILFFWVARMVMSAALYTNDIPFHTVYLHGLVKDGNGQKMSKTKGNVTDPLDVMQEYGTDALRFTLLTSGAPGNDLNLSLEKVASNRNFANKIWNATRFIANSLGSASQADKPATLSYTAADQWILTGLADITETANRLLDNYQFGEAGRQVYEFLWGEFADWYLETAKVQMQAGGVRAWITLSVLRKVLDDCLRLLHPYIPYVTEETWQQLKAAFIEADLGIEPAEGWADALIIADWPTVGEKFPEGAADYERLRELVHGIRSARTDNKVEPGRRIKAIIVGGDKTAMMQAQSGALSFLARLDEEQLEIVADAAAPDATVTIALGDITCYLPLSGMVDLSVEKERIEKELVDLQQEIKRLTGLLNSPFAQKAPPPVVAKEREKLVQSQASYDELSERLASL
jgi:valyl-tRNA synthetase